MEQRAYLGLEVSAQRSIAVRDRGLRTRFRVDGRKSTIWRIAREARKRIKGIQSLAKMRVMAVPERRSPVSHGGGDLPASGRHEVLVRVQACGVCHSDCTTVQGPMPKIGHPRIPGHEGIGVIDAVGADVDGWKVGSHVGVQWFLRLLRPVPARQCVCL